VIYLERVVFVYKYYLVFSDDDDDNDLVLLVNQSF